MCNIFFLQFQLFTRLQPSPDRTARLQASHPHAMDAMDTTVDATVDTSLPQLHVTSDAEDTDTTDAEDTPLVSVVFPDWNA